MRSDPEDESINLIRRFNIILKTKVSVNVALNQIKSDTARTNSTQRGPELAVNPRPFCSEVGALTRHCPATLTFYGYYKSQTRQGGGAERKQEMRLCTHCRCFLVLSILPW